MCLVAAAPGSDSIFFGFLTWQLWMGWWKGCRASTYFGCTALDRISQDVFCLCVALAWVQLSPNLVSIPKHPGQLQELLECSPEVQAPVAAQIRVLAQSHQKHCPSPPLHLPSCGSRGMRHRQTLCRPHPKRNLPLSSWQFSFCSLDSFPATAQLN